MENSQNSQQRANVASTAIAEEIPARLRAEGGAAPSSFLLHLLRVREHIED